MEFDSQLYCQSGKLALGVMRYSLGCYVSKSRVVGKREFNYNLVVVTVTKLWVSWVWELRLCDQCCYSCVNVMSGNVRQIQSEGENPFTTNLSEKTSSLCTGFIQLFDLGHCEKLMCEVICMNMYHHQKYCMVPVLETEIFPVMR